jgi:SAM-dependent methyltransferase
MILPPRPLTLARWWRHSGTQFSLLRSLEYESIEGLHFTGLVLDVGGGHRNSYVHLLQIEGTLETLNIDPTMRPTYLADLNGRLPIPSNRFDYLISLNTLEHVADDHNALSEMCRVLRPGGVAHLVVPFLYRVHGSPNDYHRHTASAWAHMLTAVGFAVSSIQIEPLGFGRLASAFALSEFLFPTPMRWLFKKTALLLSMAREAIRRTPQDEFDAPLGYHIVARKSVP